MGAKHRIASFTIETLQPRGLRLRLLLRISFLVHARKYTAGFGITPKPPAGSSVEAAVAAAAHATLSKLFPSQKAFFDLKHAQADLSGAKLKEGHEFGLLVAKNILDDR